MMTKSENLTSKIRNLFREKLIILCSLLLTLSISFLTSIVYNAKTSDYYTLRVLAKQTILLSLISFWVILYLVYRQKEKVHSAINKKILPWFRDLVSTKSGIFMLILSLLPLGFFLFMIIPNTIDYERPTYKYDITIKSDDAGAGNICIYSIRNSTASLFAYNETVMNFHSSEGWQQDVGDCVLFLEEGKQGEITFENIGYINDEISIRLLKGPDQGKLEITSSLEKFRKAKEIPLYFEVNNDQTVTYYPGHILFRNIPDMGLVLGIVLVLLMIVIVIPSSIVEGISNVFSTLKNIFVKNLGPISLRIREILDQRKFVVPVLFVLYIIGVLYNIFFINPMAYGPSHLGDEIRYWNTALSMSNGTFRAVDYYRYPPIYPLSLLPAFLFFDPLNTYEAAKLLNAFYITSAIFPVYLLVRKFEKRNVALLASALLLLNPIHLVIPGRILSESVFYPLFFWSVLFAFTNIFPENKRNRIIECLLFGLSLGLLFLTRYIALVLIPALLLVWWLRPYKDEKPPFFISFEKIVQVILILLPIFLMAGIWIKIGVNEGLRVKDMIGLFIAEVPEPGQLTFGRLVMWTIFYCSYMLLLAAPYLTILLSSISKFRFKKWNDDLNRWFIALAIIIGALMVACIRHSWRIPYNYPSPQKLQGRYILYFGPLFLITALGSIRKSFEKIKLTEIFVLSSSLIMISYAFLYYGFIYLDGPMNVAVSSPDSMFMNLIGATFILYLLANALLDSILLKSNKKNLMTVLVLFLFGFALFGNAKIQIYMATVPNQLENSQVYHLLFENDDLFEGSSPDGKTQWELMYPHRTEENEISYWNNTLNFYRIPNFDLREEPSLDRDPDTVFQVRYKDTILNLLRLDKAEYDKSDNTKFSHGENYFEFSPNGIVESE